MTYTLKALLLIFFMSADVDTPKNITCDELIENIIYEGVFFGALESHVLNSPFISSVTAYIYNDEIYVVSTDSKEKLTIYCNLPKDDWDAFEASCNCSYSKKFNQYITKHSCDCSSD